MSNKASVPAGGSKRVSSNSDSFWLYVSLSNLQTFNPSVSMTVGALWGTGGISPHTQEAAAAAEEENKNPKAEKQ